MRFKLTLENARQQWKLGDGSWKMGDGRWKVEVLRSIDMKTTGMSFKFEKLIIWQKAMDLGEDVYHISAKFPKSEMYNLTSQMRRAVDSIALNIAEGSILQSNKENSKFLGYSIRSIAEVVTCLHKAKRRNYIIQEDFNNNYEAAFNLINMVIAYRKKFV